MGAEIVSVMWFDYTKFTACNRLYPLQHDYIGFISQGKSNKEDLKVCLEKK